MINMAEKRSLKFKLVKRWYDKGFWTAEMVADAVVAGWITEDERKEILGE